MQDEKSIFNIVQGCINAKRDSQKAFYQFFYGFAMGICMRYCNTENDAVEVMNDGLLKIYRELHHFQPRYSNYEASLKGWMKSILVNTAIDHFRKNNRNVFTTDLNEQVTEFTGYEDSAVDKMSYKELIAIVQQLSPIYRTVFNLFVIEGYKHEEIAKQLNITAGTSKSNLAKARANIQKMIKAASINYYEQKTI